MITTIHSYTYSIWKERNSILHSHAEKSTHVIAKQALGEQIDTLYRRGRANLTNSKLQYFKLPVEQRQKKVQRICNYGLQWLKQFSADEDKQDRSKWIIG